MNHEYQMTNWNLLRHNQEVRQHLQISLGNNLCKVYGNFVHMHLRGKAAATAYIFHLCDNHRCKVDA
jgi:hypothetical protein